MYPAFFCVSCDDRFDEGQFYWELYDYEGDVFSFLLNLFPEKKG